MRRLWLFALLAVSATSPASSEWRTESEQVRAAAKDPKVAAVLTAMNAMDAAILARDDAGFTGRLAPDLAVNSPGNMTNMSAAVATSFRAGRIDYSSYDRLLDHLALQPSGEVVAMGWETVQPRGKAMNAGKTVRRRFTDIWRSDGGQWKLALRQATIVEVK